MPYRNLKIDMALHKHGVDKFRIDYLGVRGPTMIPTTVSQQEVEIDFGNGVSLTALLPIVVAEKPSEAIAELKRCIDRLHEAGAFLDEWFGPA